MHRQPFRGIGLALGGVLLVAPVAAGAQGWGHLPSGELAYGLTYTTSAMLACAPSRLVVGSCLVSGNAITFTNGGASMTLTFTGAAGTLFATGDGQMVPIGTITKSFSGEGEFTFPVVTNTNVSLMRLHISVLSTDPLVTSAGWSSGFRRLSPDELPRNCCSSFSRHSDMEITTPPPDVYFDELLWTLQMPTIDTSSDPHFVTARVVLIPEPGTVVLVGGGLLMLAGIGVRGRRRAAGRGVA